MVVIGGLFFLRGAAPGTKSLSHASRRILHKNAPNKTSSFEPIWLPAVCTWIYVDLRKVHGKNGEKSGEILDFSLFFQGFSGPDFAKISAAVLRIDLVRSRAPETKIWPISFKFSDFFHEQVCFFIVFPVFCYQAGFLATQDPSQTKDLSILIYSVVLIYW